MLLSTSPVASELPQGSGEAEASSLAVPCLHPEPHPEDTQSEWAGKCRAPWPTVAVGKQHVLTRGGQRIKEDGPSQAVWDPGHQAL